MVSSAASQALAIIFAWIAGEEEREALGIIRELVQLEVVG